MALRSFVLDGVVWNVWDVRPTSAARLLATGAEETLTGGWLCFETETEKRRVVPIPAGWEEWSDAELLVACTGATPKPRARLHPRAV